MASEIATHHRRRVRADEASAFDVYAGSLLARPFDLEDLYPNAVRTSNFYLGGINFSQEAA